jgi:hypothetical protein
MELIGAKILLRNLLQRVKVGEDGTRQLPGVLTDDEWESLQLAVGLLDGPSTVGKNTRAAPPEKQAVKKPISSIPNFKVPEFEEITVPPAEETKTKSEISSESFIELDLRALTSPEPPSNVRLCLDFGTAMSKATLVADHEGDDTETITVLPLGTPGDQPEISPHMLISSVYIDNSGLLWFGKTAVDRSMIEGADGSRMRLDNIKRRLSEDGWEESVNRRFNPTNIPITYGDMVLAYLMYLTWAANRCLEELHYPWNLHRRFAMPCLTGEKRHETVYRLKQAVGEAQVLADTFYQTLKNGIPLEDFVTAVKALRHEARNYPFVDKDITEPLGVAGSLVSWKSQVDMLIMVVDVGAGTSDFSMFRIHLNPATGQNIALEVAGASCGLQMAGNHLDRMLIEFIIKKSGITSEHPKWLNIRTALELRIRDHKESLFNDEYVFVPLLDVDEVEVELNEFLELEPVRQFGENLRSEMVKVLQSIDESWVKWVLANPSRKLVVALTGGGAELPMVKKLAEGNITANGYKIPVIGALPFPAWLRDLDENLETEYPRIAVSLGGARKRLIQLDHTAKITAGDVVGKPTLGGYYVKGN